MIEMNEERAVEILGGVEVIGKNTYYREFSNIDIDCTLNLVCQRLDISTYDGHGYLTIDQLRAIIYYYDNMVNCDD